MANCVQHLRDLLDHVSDLYQAILPSGRLIYVNSVWRKTLAYGDTDISGLSFFDILHPGSRDRYFAAMRQVMATQGSCDLSITLLTNYGQSVTVSGRINCRSTGETGEELWSVWRVVGDRPSVESPGIDSHRERPEDPLDLIRKQSGGALQVSEEQLRLALDASQIGVWDCDLKTGKVIWSANAERLFGLAAGEFDGSDHAFLACIHPADRNFVFQSSRQAIQQQTDYNIEFRVVRQSGEIRWIASKGQVLYSEIGNPIRMIGINLDVTERKALEASLRKANRALGIEVKEQTTRLATTIEQLQQEIRSRKQVEDVLNVSKEQYRSVITLLQEGVVLYDANGYIRACNASAERLLGLSAEQMYGRTAFDSCWCMIYEDGTEFPGHAHPAVLTLRTSKPCSDVVVGVYKPNGTLAWISINSQPLCHDGEPLPYAVICSFSDITERKQTEIALRNSEARYRAIVEDQTELVCRFLPDGTLTFVNDAYCQVLGISQDELIGHHYKMFLMVLDGETKETLTAALQPESPVSWLEHQMILPDGEVCWHQWNSRGIFDEWGNLIEFQAVGRDISDRKRIEEALRGTTDRLNSILQSLDDVVWSLSPDMQTTFYVSPAAEKVFGYEMVQFYNNPNFWVEIISSQDKLQVMTSLSTLFETGRLTLEYRIVCSDGVVRWVYSRSWLIQDSQGEAIRIDSILTDMTERKQAEEEIWRSLQKERELNELKSRFVSMISHEFRTPLTTIQSAAELLEHYNWSADQQQQRLQQIQVAVQHMNQLIEDVLLIGRTDAGQIHLNPTLLDLPQFCQELVSGFTVITGSKHDITVTTLGNPQAVWADPKLLRQILNNLLSNAIKYSSDETSITVEVIHQLDMVFLRVQDEGIGIPLEEQEHMFEAFFRASNVGTTPGTGLGLSIVKKCVELHGGHISCESVVGIGTTFTISLPLLKL